MTSSWLNYRLFKSTIPGEVHSANWYELENGFLFISLVFPTAGIPVEKVREQWVDYDLGKNQLVLRFNDPRFYEGPNVSIFGKWVYKQNDFIGAAQRTVFTYELEVLLDSTMIFREMVDDSLVRDDTLPSQIGQEGFSAFNQQDTINYWYEQGKNKLYVKKTKNDSTLKAQFKYLHLFRVF